jgi:hypothetical protein
MSRSADAPTAGDHPATPIEAVIAMSAPTRQAASRRRAIAAA